LGDAFDGEQRKSFDRFKARVRGTSKVFSRRLGGGIYALSNNNEMGSNYLLLTG
jgi:hypothetical protein